MTVNIEKVVGTSFVEQVPLDQINGTLCTRELTASGVDEIYTEARLVPDPTNEYDPTAVAVYVQTKDGQAHRVGYLARNSTLKPYIKGIVAIDMTIYDYNEVDKSNSYVLRYKQP